MSTQFDQVFEGLSKNSMTLEDACRVLYTESQASPENMRVCCERIEIELSQGRISSDAAQLLLDALGERSKEEHDSAAGEEIWVDVPLEPVEASRAAAVPATKAGEPVTEVDLTMDDLLAALDRRGAPIVAKPAEIPPTTHTDLAAPVEWMEWEPEDEPLAATAVQSSAVAPVSDIEPVLEAELDLRAAIEVAAPQIEVPAPVTREAAAGDPVATVLEEVTAPVAVVAELVAETQPKAALMAEASLEATEDAVSLTEIEPLATDLPASTEVLTQVDDLVPVPIEAHTAQAVTEAGGAAVVVAIEQDAEASPVATAAVVPVEDVAVAIASEPAPVEPAAIAVPQVETDQPLESNLVVEPTLDEVFAPRVEHVLKESLPMAAGSLLKDRYRIVGSLAPGGLGQLFEAIDTQAPGAPRVALKLIEVDWQEEPRAFETLQAIVRHVRRLRHPNILSILDIDRDDKHAIIAMEALQGCWLSSLVREVRGRGVGYAVAWNIISGIANGLAYAHQHGAVHSELNPHMVFLTDGGQVKIVGFGLAHAMPMSTEPLPALDGQTLRSYADAYCATHWILGSIPQGVDDLYPLGVIAYELLTGAHPFDRMSPTVAAGHQLQPLPIPGLDRRIRRVIERCLSFDRKDRPVSGANFLAHIEPAEKLLDLIRERLRH